MFKLISDKAEVNHPEGLPSLPLKEPKIKSFGSFKWIELQQSTVLRVFGNRIVGHACLWNSKTEARSVLLCESTFFRFKVIYIYNIYLPNEQISNIFYEFDEPFNKHDFL